MKSFSLWNSGLHSLISQPSKTDLGACQSSLPFSVPVLFLGDLGFIIIECECLALGLELACPIVFFFSLREQWKHRSSQCTPLAVTFLGTQLFNSGFLLVHLWQDLPQHRRTWSTTSTRPRLAWNGARQQTRVAATMSPTGLYAGVAAGNPKSVFRVGPMWDTPPHSQD